MDMSAPYSVLLTRTEGRILSTLAGTTRPLSGREVARLSGTSPNGAWKTLRRFVEHGLVTEREAGGKTLLYTLNRDHLAADTALILTDLRSRLTDRLKARIEGWAVPPFHVCLFGSAARGDGDTGSDVDLVVIRPSGVNEADEQWRTQLDELADAVLSWTGNHAGISEIAHSDIARLERERPAILDELERDGIVLCGAPVKDVFAGKRR
jgi:predicted nucleotidyltransferase